MAAPTTRTRRTRMTAMSESALADYPLVIRRHVKWGEMDAFRHVNNTVYFRYFEDARIAHFEQLGVMRVMEADNQGPILASTRARFRAPLTWPDEVLIGSRIRELGDDRFTMEYAIHSVAMERVACEGEGQIVYFDYGAGAKCAVPDSIRRRIEKEL